MLSAIFSFICQRYITFPSWFNTENVSLSKRMITPTVWGLKVEKAWHNNQESPCHKISWGNPEPLQYFQLSDAQKKDVRVTLQVKCPLGQKYHPYFSHLCFLGLHYIRLSQQNQTYSSWTRSPHWCWPMESTPLLRSEHSWRSLGKTFSWR